MADRDVVNDLFPQAQAAVAARVHEILDAVNAQDVDRLDAHHLWGPKFSKFDDGEPAGRQDAATTRQLERELVAAARAISFRAEDLKIDVFGPAAVATFVLDWSATMPDGETYASRSRATLVLVDDRGDWKIAHEHFSVFPGAA
jgi:ketosteroid isomerase-like protein